MNAASIIILLTVLLLAVLAVIVLTRKEDCSSGCESCNRDCAFRGKVR